MSEFLSQLQSSPRKRIALAELKQHFYSLQPEVQNHPQRASLLLAELRNLEALGHLTLPAQGSWEKVGAPALPNFVQLVRERPQAESVDYAEVPWVPELGFWPLLKPAQLATAKCINDFLLRRRKNLGLVPIKERSLEIFGDEKRLDELRTGKTLFGGRLALETLGAFQVPLPLPYRQADAAGKPVLVVENHNTFWSFGEWNHTARQFAAVVFGSGEAFRSTGAALGQVLREVEGNGALYLGDLDPKGIRIPLDFNACVQEGEPKVAPALQLYRWLLDRRIQRSKTDCSSADPTLAAAWLGAELGSRLADVWRQGRWLPQEALGIEALLSGALD